MLHDRDLRPLANLYSLHSSQRMYSVRARIFAFYVFMPTVAAFPHSAVYAKEFTFANIVRIDAMSARNAFMRMNFLSAKQFCQHPMTAGGSPLSVCVTESVCVSERERVCVCERERVCVCVRERECV